ncbi:regulator of g-protein signaling 3 [Lynx pardinus]|uniref:Regulator of g-protein signaling 3 n=1 Tax=Lynx pardinus TaxID=191816 RepID=A0A485PAN5_LYNPA|nr:regulator of g-protein signaling 3 [Lynx pardinus]
MERSLHRVSLGSRRAHPDLSFYLTTFGQLKLSIDAQDRVLLLHIIEGKGLMSKEPGICDPYVKISLIPEDNHRLRRQKTQTILGCREPVFHEHFFFLVQEEDEQKRLLVTVWNRAGDSRQSGFIGCMSFGVKSLLTPDKEINGWYYLLGEHLGRTKHLKVARRRLRPLRGPLQRIPGYGDTESGEKLKITIPRGKDGFGFTICCDSPVRVQAVDSGKGMGRCDRGEPPVRGGVKADTARWHDGVSEFMPQNVNPVRYSGKEVSEKILESLIPPSTSLCSLAWPLFFLLSYPRVVGEQPAWLALPVPGAELMRFFCLPLQLLRPLYQEDAIPEESGGPSKGKSYTGLGKKSRLMKTVQTMKGHGNYQNCPVMRPHTPHSSYGTYVTLAPKVLVFPVFVQPLDLCNPARTLLLSEELLLYEGRNKAVEVTLFAYSDLLLFTKEDEPGRCNVLRNPLYLQSVKLQEGSSEDLKFCVLYLAEKAECLFTLEAHSQEQKKRVCWCLSENIAKQQQLAASPPESKSGLVAVQLAQQLSTSAQLYQVLAASEVTTDVFAKGWSTAFLLRLLTSRETEKGRPSKQRSGPSFLLFRQKESHLINSS